MALSQITVVFASSDGALVDQHFGSARHFVVCSVTTENHAIMTTHSFAKEAQDGNEDKLVGKIQWLKSTGADVLVCAQVGGSAARQILAAGTQPIAVDGRPPVNDVIEQLQSDLHNPETAWVKRVAKNRGDAAPERLEALLEDDWSE